MTADHAVYNEATGDLDAQGHIEYLRPPLTLSGTSAKLNTRREQGSITNTEFSLSDHHARGEASEAQLDGVQHTRLQQVTYTTCDPGNQDWLLRATRVDLDHDSGFGTARHVRLSFMHVPIFYFPYMSFPISDKRKTGFLTPNLGRSNDNGAELWLPYYINIAPNLDATLTPRIMSRRGTLLQGELRYLTERHYGTLDLEYLPNDRIYNDGRSLAHYQHTSLWTPRWSSHIDASHVSDASYFDDFGNSLSTSSITHLHQRADLQYQGAYWHGTMLVENYQTVDDTIPSSNRPYKRLPALSVGINPATEPGEIAYLLDSQYVHFSHTTLVSGDRLHVVPGLRFPYSTPAMFVTPSLKLAHTRYETEDSAGGANISQERSVPVFSVDSGIYLERYTEQYLQTLEPRLFYLYIPYRSQDDLPLFDTGTSDFTFNRLLAENRFNGLDRIGDANQLSTMLTTRLIDQESGEQRFKAAIGQIVYFADRRLTLGGKPAETASSSDVLAQTEWNAGKNLTLLTDLRWQHDWQMMETGSVTLRYQQPQRRIVNIAYRYRRDRVEQDDVSFLWPLAERWHMVGSWSYSQQDDRVLETLAGLEYQDCCWALRFMERRYLNTDTDDYQNNLYIQLELKGLTNVGNKIESLLENGILGYY